MTGVRGHAAAPLASAGELSPAPPGRGFERCGAVLVLTALGGPFWNVILVGLPGADLTVGRALIVLATLLLARAARRAPRPLPRIARAVWLLLGALALLWTWTVGNALIWGCGCAGELAGFSELIALVTLAALAAALEPRLRPVLVLAVIAGAVLTALMAIAGVDGLSAGTRNPQPAFGRLAGPYGNPNFLAFAIGFAIPAGLATLFVTKGRARVVLGLVLALLAIVLLLTYSRGALLAVGAGAVVVAVLAQRPGSRAQMRTIASVAAIGVLSAIAYPIFVEHRRASTSPALIAHLRALDRSGWDAGPQGLIGGGPARLRNPSLAVLEVRTDAPARGVSHPLPRVSPADSYELRFEARAIAGAQRLRFGLEDNERGNGPVATAATLASAWQKLHVRWTPTVDSPRATLYIWAPAGGAGFQVRDLHTVARRAGGPAVTTAISPALRGSSYGDLERQEARRDARDVRSREVGIRLSLRAFAAQPVRGIGWGRFTQYSSAHSTFRGLPTHNEYLRFLAELGIVGAALLMLVGLIVAATFWRRRLDPLGLALLGMLVTGAVGLAFANALVAPAAAAPLGFAVALACARSASRERSLHDEASWLWAPGLEGDADRPRGRPWGVAGLGGPAVTRRAADALERVRSAVAMPAPPAPAPAFAAGIARLREGAPGVRAAGWQRWMAQTERRLRRARRRARLGLRALVARGPLRARAGARRQHSARRPASSRRGRFAASFLVLVTLVTALVVGPAMHVSGTLTEARPLELGEAAAPPGATTRGAVSEDVDGYRVAAGGDAVVSVPLALPRPAGGHTLLRVWAYGPPGVRTTAVLRAADGSERALGRATSWIGQTFDVTDEARRGSAQLRVRGENSTTQSVLFFDRIAPITGPRSLAPRAPGWAVGLLIGLVTAALLGLTARLRRHWALAPVLALTAAVLWDRIERLAFQPLELDGGATWSAATSASWLGLHDGVLWGSWTSLSSLAVQIDHALTPIVGTAPGGARAAALLTALLACAAIYAFGHRAAGRLGALVALLLAIAAVGLRDAIVAGGPLPALVLAAALFGYALHACLTDATPAALVMLGACAALLALAEPTWLPGALVAVVIVALVCTRRPLRWQAAAAGLAALLVCLVPHLASTANQNDGRMLATLDARAIAARNAEFRDGEHGVPTPLQLARDPLSGRRIGLADYIVSGRSPAQIAGGVLTGGQRSLTAFNRTERGGLRNQLAFVIGLLGALFLLVLPRLRLLVALTALVVAPALFISGRTPFDPAVAGAALWPVMLTGAGVLAVATASLAAPLLAPHRAKIDALRARRPRTTPRDAAAAPPEGPRT